MDKIDLEGFFIKNKIALTAVLVVAILIVGAFFGIRYYNGVQSKKSF